MKKLLILGLLAGLTACKKEAPKCNDSEVKKLVIEIIYNDTFKYFENKFLPTQYRNLNFFETEAKLKEAIYQAKQKVYEEVEFLNPKTHYYIFDSIRTIDFDEKTGTFKCKGLFKAISKETKEEPQGAEYVYIVELTDDGDNFMVSVLN